MSAQDGLSSTMALVVAELVILALFTVLLLRYFRSPELTPFFISCTVCVSWFLGFSGTLLLPLDIAHAATVGSSSSLLMAWDGLYWSTFWLCWVVLPVLYEAWYAGDLTWRARMVSAVKVNLKFYLAVGLLGLVAAIYLISSKQMTFGGLSDFLMVFGNTYGLLLVVILMGNGLVELPRSIWRMKDTSQAIERLQLHAVAVDTEVYDSRCELEDAEKQARRMQLRLLDRGASKANTSPGAVSPMHEDEGNGDNDDNIELRRADSIDSLQEHMNLIIGTCDEGIDDHSYSSSSSSSSLSKNPSSTSSHCSARRRSSSPSTSLKGLGLRRDGKRKNSGSAKEDVEKGDEDTPTAASLAKLHRRVRIAQERARASHLRWNSLLRDYMVAKDATSSLDRTLQWSQLPRRSTTDGGVARGGAGGGDSPDDNEIDEEDGSGSGTRLTTTSAPGSSRSSSGSSSNGGGSGHGDAHGSLFATLQRKVRFSGVGRACLALMAIFCGILSVLVIWCELTMGLPVFMSPWGLAISALSGAAKRDGSIDSGDNSIIAWIQLVAVVPYAYMSLCTFYSLFKVNLFGMLALYGPRHSTPGPLLFNAIYLIRLQFPLGFNYLLTVYPPNLHGSHAATGENVAFNQLMSNMDTVPLFGTGFVVYAPILLVVLCAFTLFNCYARMLRVIGIEYEDAVFVGDDDQDMADRRREGSILLDRAIRKTNSDKGRNASVDDGRHSSAHLSSAGLRRQHVDSEPAAPLPLFPSSSSSSQQSHIAMTPMSTSTSSRRW